jgi:hypothetical protein
MAKWSKQTYRLPKDHGWKVKPGYKSFVADHGTVRFDFPQDWVFVPGTNSLKFHDREPPDDTCVLEMSVFHLTEGPDWSKLPLTQLLEETWKGDRDELSRGEIVYEKRGDLEIAWVESRVMDPGEHREARSRCCLARRGLIQPLFTCAYWPEDEERVTAVWDEVLRSLRLGEYVTLPVRRGRN